MLSYSIATWLSLGLICMVLELLVPGLFFCLSFALATLPAAAACWYGWGMGLQIIVFVISSLLSFFILYLCVGTKSQKDIHYKSVVDALPGKKGHVTSSILPSQIGQVQVEGQVWSAQSVHQESLFQGTSITVVRVEGVRLIVRADKH